MDYKNLAKDILQNVGGKENVQLATHCATRLRLNLKDDKKANMEALKELTGVMGVVNKGGQFQVVIGSDVANLYRAFADLGDFDNGGAGDGEAPAEKKKPIVAVLDTIAGIFTPIIPAITGAGMLKAVMALLVTFKVIDTSAQTYQILNFIADAAFYFLPFMLAVSASKKFKCNPYMAMTIAGVLMHPNFTAMVTAAKASGTGISFIGIPVTLASYSSSVIPIILSVLFMSFVEPIADKISPKPIKFFTKPLLTLIVTGAAALWILGPIGTICGDGIAFGINGLNQYVPWLVPLLVGTFSPLLVMTGMHYGLIPIGINNIATAGFDTVVGPGMLVSNIAQGGAALAVAVRTKNKEMKQLATSAGITAVCGITEPAMYGVNLKLKKPLYAVMLSGAVTGAFLGITGVGRYTSGSPGLLALPGYIGTEGFSNITFACIGGAAAFVIAFVLTLVFGFKDIPEKADKMSSPETADKPENMENTANTESIANTANTANTESITNTAAANGTSTANTAASETVYAPMQGNVIPLSEVDDPTFAQEIMGKGAAIEPTEGKLYAPFDGKVDSVFETKHAICLISSAGAEVLIHIGIDTVKLNGKYFDVKVQNGDVVTRGQLLAEFDLAGISSEGYPVTTPIIVTNTDDYAEILAATGTTVQPGMQVLQLNR